MLSPLVNTGFLLQLRRLDVAGWAAVAYVALPCTILGFALWSWLLKHLPATFVGFAIFLNPPSTTLSKSLLAAALPAVFVFQIHPREWIRGLVTLSGMAIALLGRRR